MKKTFKYIYIGGCILSAGIGLSHFFFPYIFSWYSYIPNIPYNLKTSIDYINFFFSLLLLGNSLICIKFTKNILNKNNKESLYIGYFLSLIWFSRVIINIVLPSNGKYDFMFLGQLIMSLIIFGMIFIPIIISHYKKSEINIEK